VKNYHKEIKIAIIRANMVEDKESTMVRLLIGLIKR
jgi:hypothetical protein